MPTVTVTMNDNAYNIFREWQKGTRSGRLSAAIQLWHAQVIEQRNTPQRNEL